MMRSMFIVKGTSPNRAVDIRSDPLQVEEALRRVISMRDEGFINMTVTQAETGIEVDIERFMRNPTIS